MDEVMVEVGRSKSRRLTISSRGIVHQPQVPRFQRPEEAKGIASGTVQVALQISE